MGLRVWLPLNGSLENQGLSNVIFTNNGAATNTNGKIGGCYSFNGSSNYLKATYNFYSSQYTVSAWVYTTSTSATQNIVCDRTSVGSGFAIFLIDGKLRIDSGGNNLQWTTNYTFPANIWFHLTIIYDGTDTSYYINGVFQEKKAHTISSSYWGNTTSVGSSQANGTGWGNFLNGRLNDVRIYDHALSVKEVRELARGLIVHYKLDDVRLSNANRITTYDPSFHSYADGAVTLFYNQMNGGTQEIISDFAGAHKCLHLHSNGGNNRQYSTIAAYSGKTYTVSCDYYSTVNQNSALVIELYGGDYSWTSKGVDYTKPNQWVRLHITYENLTSATTIYYFMRCSNGTDCYIKNIKVEEGADSTPFSYTNDRPTKVTDDSGLKHHGTIGNTLTAVYDTPRYDCSTYFNTTASKITLPAINFSGTSITYTFAWWQYMVNTARMAWGFGNGNRLNVYYSNPICWNTGDGTSTPFQDGATTINPSELLNSWHHIAVTGDGAAAKIYIDGVYRGTAKTWRAITGTQIYISGWDTGTNYSWSGGKLSDFRIYATTLTATDVHDLYATSAEVDRNGNYYSREVIEK